MIGRQLGNYRLVERLGEGGMATVYRAEHVHMGTPAAVKVLASNLAGNENIRVRFNAEASVMAFLDHPNIITVHDFVVESELLAIVMEYIDGSTLHDFIVRSESPLSPSEVLPILSQIADAVGFAHDNGVVHRDLKPSNVMMKSIANRTIVKVLDFGLAKIIGDGPQRTRTGAKMGTLLYMAPEQCLGAKNVTHEVDIYALGVMLYEMLAGKVPFDGESEYEIMKAQIETPPPPLVSQVKDLTEPVEKVVIKALSKEPADRWATVGSLVSAFEKAVSNRVGADATPIAKTKVPPISPQPEPGTTSTAKDEKRISGMDVMKALELCGAAVRAEKDGNVENALQSYRKALELDPSHKEAADAVQRLTIALLKQSVDQAIEHASSGSPVALKSHLRRALELADASASSKPQLLHEIEQRLLTQVDALERTGDLKEAMVFLENAEDVLGPKKALKTRGQSLTSRVRELGLEGIALLKADALLEEKNWEHALRCLDEAERNGAERPEVEGRRCIAHIAMAATAMKVGQFDEAKQYLDVAEKFGVEKASIQKLRKILADRIFSNALNEAMSATDCGDWSRARRILGELNKTSQQDSPELRALRNRVRRQTLEDRNAVARFAREQKNRLIAAAAITVGIVVFAVVLLVICNGCN